MALVGPVFLDTSILLAGVVDFGTPYRSALRVFDAVADGKLEEACTAWHCCLEFFSVSTRLPMEFRLPPTEALFLLKQEILSHLRVIQLPEESLETFLESAVDSRIRGGRIYDVHIAEIAKSATARIVLTENRRHFSHLLKEEIRVLTADQAVRELEQS